MKINFVMPYYATFPYGNETRLVNFLNTEEGKALGFEYHITDLRRYPEIKGFLKEEYDAQIVFKGEMLSPEVLQQMSGVKILYFPDDILVYPQYAELIEYLGPHYDLVYTFDKKAIPKFYELGCKNVKWLPIFTGKDLFFDRGWERDIDICFIGSMNEQRKEMLDYVQKKFPDKKLLFADNIRGEEYSKIMSRSKIVLNLAQGQSGTSQRVLEASACGALVCTNWIPKDERLYDQLEVIYWTDLIDLCEGITLMLKPNSKLKESAKAGYDKTMSKHLVNHRVREMLQDITALSDIVIPKKPQKAEAQLSWSLFVTCPYCQSSIDLAFAPYDDDGVFSIPIFNNKWDSLKGEEVSCYNCDQVFTLDKIEY